jgi:hypothetical protein
VQDSADHDPFEEPRRLRSLHRLATLLWAGPLLTAIGLFVWVAVRTPPPRATLNIIGDTDGILAILTGILLLVVCVPYAILAALVRAERRWAVIALEVLAALQGAAQLYPVIALAIFVYQAGPDRLPVEPQTACLEVMGGYTLGLFATARHAGKLANEMRGPRRQPGGFPVVPLPRDPHGGAPTKRAA